jgi:ketosteroid isomerase-like protein
MQPIDTAEAATIAAIERFNEAFNRHDVDSVMAAMTDDCIFESTSPPDGGRFEGQTAVRAVWEGFFYSSPDAVFETEELFAARDRAVVR